MGNHHHKTDWHRWQQQVTRSRVASCLLVLGLLAALVHNPELDRLSHILYLASTFLHRRE